MGSDVGLIVGDYEDGAGSHHGFLPSGGNYTAIDFPGSAATLLGGINNLGQMVGEYADGQTTRGFVASEPVPEPRMILPCFLISLGLLGCARKRRGRY